MSPEPAAAFETDSAEPTKAERRRQQILEAALDVFTRRGYGDAAMDEIASMSSTCKGGLYFHFASKQALFGALLDRTAGLIMNRLEAAVAAESDPLRRADAAIAQVLHVFVIHRSLSRLFLIDATATSSPRGSRPFACALPTALPWTWPRGCAWGSSLREPATA